MNVGEMVLASGMPAELRSTQEDNPDTALVRWLNYSADHPGGWWGHHHSRVPWSTIQPWKDPS